MLKGRLFDNVDPSLPPYFFRARFLYDLFRAVAKVTGFGEDEACGSKWEDLSGMCHAILSGLCREGVRAKKGSA